MIKSKKAYISKILNRLQTHFDTKDSYPVIISLDEWLNSDDQSLSFADYVKRVNNKHPNATILVDYMILETNLNVDDDIILTASKETIQMFVDIAKQNDELKYMQEYIKLFDGWADIDDLEPKEEYIKRLSFYDDRTIFINGRYLSKQECMDMSYQNTVERYELRVQTMREVLSEASTPFYLDFFDHYKNLSVDELIERYKNNNFLKGKSA